MMFYIGQPVVCIRTSRPKRFDQMFPNLVWPVQGQRYIVRAYTIGGTHPCILVNGIHNREVLYSDGKFREAGFLDRRFRPATDIGLLNELLTNTKKEIEDDVYDERYAGWTQY